MIVSLVKNLLLGLIAFGNLIIKAPRRVLLFIASYTRSSPLRGT